MAALSKIEIEILQKLSTVIPAIKVHMPFLIVKDRQFTGMGMYTNFIYTNNDHPLPELNMKGNAISTDERIDINGLKYGIGYELYIENNAIKFLEFFTYGEDWDGNFDNYQFVKNN